MSAGLALLVSSPMWADCPIVPHSLLELAAALRAAGLPVALVDRKLPPHAPLSKAAVAVLIDEIVAEVARRSPAWVGLSCFTSDYWCCRELAERIRERTPVPIVVGGPHPTLRPADFFYPGSPFDVAVIGEGDVTLPELVADDGGRARDEVRGIAFRRGGGVVRTSRRPFVEDLGTLSRPAYDLLDMEYYLRPNRFVARTLLLSGVQIYTSRGCPFGCTFCAARMIQEAQGLAPTIRHRPVAHVIETLRWLREGFALESFYIADDTFAVPPSRALEFCQGYRASGLGLPWAAQTRVNVLDEPLARELRDAGCVQLDFGIESGSDAALRRMRKGTTVADAHRAVALCREHGLRVFANIMLNTPGETEEDVRLTRRLMRELRADHYSLLLTAPMPGSRIFEERFGADGLGPEDYRVFARPDLYNRIVDPRLRLASHDLDLGRLYVALNLRYYLRNNFSIVSCSRWYLRLLAASRRKPAYLAAAVSSVLRVSWRSLTKLVALVRRR
ncbi:MAG TPA: radical SAM protein [bacterium]